ncbi:molybdopterin molybdotransferase MoeA [Flavobacterium muglaense]|uniref:Molybdopterin molybdenumtransferase n=1 Tax=Flavobacterium muglaense TaxID=2764716 RepID=A0A923N0Y4_9FLAO|nr:gephyrin-like molybdotransferase Glp [Flavobacterium muglaense]MBC5838654.1 molybdopterin molybdotransferase MoeA [Flavobacterium muglaense]MBC5845212.1 molybdopterin molybdotransferase MoeA [Flavobacterium muglaense]
MIQVDQALSIIAQNSAKMPVKKIKVGKALGYVLAETIYSPIDMPPFRQSAMDGYAFVHTDLNTLSVVSSSQAGDYQNIKLSKDQAVRIFTGAYVPDDADTVVMQEHTTATGNAVVIDKFPAPFANIRKQGEQIQKGQLVLEKNTIITAAAIGFFACLGITLIKVYSKPKVAILVTGNELVRPGKKLAKGKIFESNSVMLQAALKEVGIKKPTIFRVKDSLKATTKIIESCLTQFDILLISGGISVGDYDFVKEALLQNGVEELFYKINQKPGKPLFFGKKDKQLVFALPGNPASSLTCFYVYALPALKKRLGFTDIHLPKMNRKITSAFHNNTAKTLFLKGFYNDETVTVLESQSSAMLNTFAVANCFIYIPHTVENVAQQQEIQIIPFS